MTEFGRIFNQARKDQGFRSQEHLDAFYRYFDHTESCPECQKPGEPMLLDDGYQPTCNRCDVARELDKAQWKVPMNLSEIISPECASMACTACNYEDCACECHLRAEIEEDDDPSQDEYDGIIGGY